MARIGILRYQELGNPWIFTSKRKARIYVDAGTHEWVSKRTIRELTAYATPSSDPSLHCVTESVTESITVLVPENVSLNPPAISTNLVLYYPVRDMSSNGERNFQEIWTGRIEVPSLARLREIYGPAGYTVDATCKI